MGRPSRRRGGLDRDDLGGWLIAFQQRRGDDDDRLGAGVARLVHHSLRLDDGVTGVECDLAVLRRDALRFGGSRPVDVHLAFDHGVVQGARDDLRDLHAGMRVHGKLDLWWNRVLHEFQVFARSGAWRAVRKHLAHHAWFRICRCCLWCLGGDARLSRDNQLGVSLPCNEHIRAQPVLYGWRGRWSTTLDPRTCLIRCDPFFPQKGRRSSMRRDNAPNTMIAGNPMWARYAFAWSLLFGIASLYWAAGGTIGLSTLAQAIQDRARDKDAGFLILTAVTGVLKIGAGLVALATIQRWGQRFPRRLLLILTVGIGVLFTLYGLANVVDKVLMVIDVRAVPDGMGDDVVLWYLLLWEPFWTLGGVLFLLTAWAFRKSPTIPA